MIKIKTECILFNMLAIYEQITFDDLFNFVIEDENICSNLTNASVLFTIERYQDIFELSENQIKKSDCFDESYFNTVLEYYNYQLTNNEKEALMKALHNRRTN